MPAHWDPIEFRELLDAEEIRVCRRLSGNRADMHRIITGSENANIDDEHDPEGSTIAFERQQIAALTRDAQERLAQIEAARQRLAEGSYGTCDVCAGNIPLARLKARPITCRCIECA